ncbi:MAG TPA: hypothetical protein DCZ91_15380 [Lachnospiraceae bacterium]|nr:hypothetical protein [Lachnospiraceae bacterium]
MGKVLGYLLVLFCCVQALSACGNSREVNNWDISEDSQEESAPESGGTEIPDEAGEGTDEVAGASEQESTEHLDERIPSEESVPEEEPQEEEKKKVFAEEDTIFDNALPVNGEFTIFKNDGESRLSRSTYNKPMAEKILKDILEAGAEGAKRAEDWTPDMAAGPIYSIMVWGGEGWLERAAWCNGYWFSPNGVPYKFDYDFEAVIDGYDWDEQGASSRADGRLVWEWFNREGWFPQTLWPRGEWPEPPEGLTAEAISMEDNILTVKITNSGEESWDYGMSFTLDMLLDGIWYGMLPIPRPWGFDDYWLWLGAGESVEREYGFTMYYGVLPEGKYRIIIAEKLPVEFTVE